MSKLVYFLLALSLDLFMKSNAINYSNTSSTICSASYCGGVLIRYPFWQKGYTTAGKSCGYPDFGLTCSGDAPPILALPSDTYYVKEINYTSNTFTLVDIDVVNQACPRARHNVTVGNLPLSYNKLDMNLTFYFNCTAYPPFLSHIACLKNSEMKRSYVFEEGDEAHDYSWFTNCEDKVVVTVNKNEIDSASLTTGFGAAMNKGFVFNWETAKQCAKCELSRGNCGYDNIHNQSLCYCKDGSITNGTKSCKGNHLSVTNKVIVGVSASAVSVLVMLIAFYIYQRRKKNSYAKSYIKSESISSISSLSLKDLEKGSRYFGLPVFSYDELEEATNYFDSEREIGDGGFGTVYFGKLRDGRYVAVKRLYENNYRRLEQFKTEVEILARFRHQNLVSLYGCTSRHSRELLLVYEYIPNGTVADHLHGQRAKPGALSWDIRMNIAIETASAIAYLHASDIIHRDVKTNNILLDNHFTVKVADFGLSRLFPDNVTHISTAPQGTPGYVDPEYHECYQLTNKSDVYSFGVVLIELISSMPAVDITRHRHEINLSNMAINKIQNRALHEIVDPNLGFESDYKVRKDINAVAELAFQCLQSLKDMRPSMEEVLERLKDIQSDGKHKGKAEEMDISADHVVLLKNEPPPPSPDSNLRSTSTTPNDSR